MTQISLQQPLVVSTAAHDRKHEWQRTRAAPTVPGLMSEHEFRYAAS